MKFLLGILGGLLISINAWSLPPASDFKEVGVSETEAESGEEKDSEAEKPKLGENEEILAGTVRVLRKIQMTEVFFKDLKESYFIPSGAKYSSIYKACEESAKKNTPMGFKVNTKSRRILSLEQAPAKNPTGGVDVGPAPTSGGSK